MSIYKKRFVFVSPTSFFATIRKDELEILSKLTQLENYRLDDIGDVVIIDNLPIIDSVNPPTKLALQSTNSFSSMINGCNGTVPYEIINGYRDVFGLDQTLKDKANLFCFYEDKIYQGCVWIFENKDYLGIYGIRASLANTLNDKRGIATQILREVIDSTSKIIVVPWPLQSMIHLLRKSGFIEHNDNEMNPVRQFLEPYTSTSNYWTLRSQHKPHIKALLKFLTLYPLPLK